MSSQDTPLLSRSRMAGSSFLWRTGATFIAVGMIAGAFGTHGLRKVLTVDKLAAWQTASQYAIFNGLGLLAVSMHPRFSAHRFAGPAVSLGGLVFSGSVMGLVLDSHQRFRFLGPITPLGGSLMIAGYVSLLFP
ncbi:DUF423-domain-containing protein [Schizopora paradoxa]|uniref:DUF423-domain-containing protein n=1 Tax=Schizopora paradoxa TaxID=27342 RepID=A0A0H2RP52_9AGAM|nr:DUF423-domain-containing protein [Schizopora paradoxa]